jgi:hypothetical protein
VEDNEEIRLLGGGRVAPTRSRQSAFVEKLKHLPLVEGWATYMHQEAMLAGLALALLYFTVLRCVTELHEFETLPVALCFFSREFYLLRICYLQNLVNSLKREEIASHTVNNYCDDTMPL